MGVPVTGSPCTLRHTAPTRSPVGWQHYCGHGGGPAARLALIPPCVKCSCLLLCVYLDCTDKWFRLSQHSRSRLWRACAGPGRAGALSGTRAGRGQSPPPLIPAVPRFQGLSTERVRQSCLDCREKQCRPLLVLSPWCSGYRATSNCRQAQPSEGRERPYPVVRLLVAYEKDF